MGHYLDVKHDTGIAYGDGFAQGDAVCGSVMKLVGDDLFAVADDPAEPAFGILFRGCRASRGSGQFWEPTLMRREFSRHSVRIPRGKMPFTAPWNPITEPVRRPCRIAT